VLTGDTPQSFRMVKCDNTDLLIYSELYPVESLRPAMMETAKMH